MKVKSCAEIVMTSVVVLFSTLPTVGDAQVPGAFRGTVTRDSSRIPLEGIEIIIEGVGTTRSSSEGKFAFAPIAPGLYSVRIRHPAYRVIEGRVRIAAGETKDLSFAIWPLIPELSRVEVTGTAVPLSIGMTEFEQRRASGFGKFLTARDFEGRANATLADVLGTSVPGLIVERLPSGAAVVASRRSTQSSFRQSVTPGVDPNKCYLQVFVDGTRVWRPGFDQLNTPPNMNEFRSTDIAGVEIYRGAAETPTQFSGPYANCGTIVIWTGKRP